MVPETDILKLFSVPWCRAPIRLRSASTTVRVPECALERRSLAMREARAPRSD